MDPTALILYTVLALLLAGVVKGAVGLGLPTTAVGLLTLGIDPRTAISLVIVPMLVSNVWQLVRAGEVPRTVRRYAPFAICVVLGVLVSFWLFRTASDRFVLAGLGVIFLLYVASSLSSWAPRVTEATDRPIQITAGSIAGVMGGIGGVWAPPVAIYLSARGADKQEFVRGTGLLLMAGSMPLLWSYAREGFLTGPNFWLSVALLVPTFLGFSLGERIRHRLSETAFRKVLLVFFAIMGLNLLRRALLV